MDVSTKIHSYEEGILHNEAVLEALGVKPPGESDWGSHATLPSVCYALGLCKEARESLDKGEVKQVEYLLGEVNGILFALGLKNPSALRRYNRHSVDVPRS